MKLTRLVLALAALPLAGGCAGLGASGPAVYRSNPTTTPLTGRNFTAVLGESERLSNGVHMRAVQRSAVADDNETVSADIDLQSAKARVNLEWRSGDDTLVVRVVGGVGYLYSPTFTAGEYVEIDPRTTTDHDAKELVDETADSRPAKYLQRIRGGLTGFRAAGEGGRIDGSPTMRYIATVKASTVMHVESLDAKDLGARVPKAFRYELLVGKDGLLRRISVTYAKFSIRYDFTHWDEQVSVTAPPRPETLQLGVKVGSSLV